MTLGVGSESRTSRIQPPARDARDRALWIVVFALYTVGTIVLVAYTAWSLVPYGDWNVWERVPDRLAELRLYDHSDPAYTWVWSPLAAWLIAVVVLPIGPWVWAALHLAALPLLRDWRLMAFVGLSYPFWMDTLMANTFAFSALMGFAAWRGNRWAGIGYLALLVLMPRPVQLPLAALLLWRDRSLWLPFAGFAVVGVVTTVGSGYAADWLRVLVGLGADYPSQEFNLSPTRILGPVWLLVGIPLAVWLTTRKHPGWAGLAMTPYLVPQYLLILLLELRPAPPVGRVSVASCPGRAGSGRKPARVHQDRAELLGETWPRSASVRAARRRGTPTGPLAAMPSAYREQADALIGVPHDGSQSSSS